jgi:hypothetical protein
MLDINKVMSDIIKKAFENIDPEAEKRLDEKLKNGSESFGLYDVSDMFSFAKYLEENYDYHDNTDEGDIYIHKGNKLKYTEDKIYLTWSNYR